jgi:cell wall-associated NlpC family hydrolase
MKKILIITALALTFAFIAPSAEADSQEQKQPPQQNSVSIIEMMIEMKMQNRIAELTEHVDKTWYVFSGSTTGGWDCSGLVMWFYSGFDIELEHSATKQKKLGQIFNEPMIGDIVSISYPNSKWVYHNGIYIGDGNMIHAPRPGRLTEIRKVSEVSLGHTVTYTRLISRVVD